MGLLDEARKKRLEASAPKDTSIPDLPEPPDIEARETQEVSGLKKSEGFFRETKKEKKGGLFGFFKKKEVISEPLSLGMPESSKIDIPEPPSLDEFPEIEARETQEVSGPKKEKKEEIVEKKKKKGLFGFFKKKEVISEPSSLGMPESSKIDIPEPPSLDEFPEPPSLDEEKFEPPKVEKKKEMPKAPKAVPVHPVTVELKEEHKNLDIEIDHKKQELKQLEHDFEAKKSMVSDSEAHLDKKEKEVTGKIEELKKIKDDIENHKKDMEDRTEKLEKARILLEKQHGAIENHEKRGKELDEREKKIKEREEGLLKEQKELEEGEFKEYMSDIMKNLKEKKTEVRIYETDPELVDYIRKHIDRGISPHKIEETLKHAGWAQHEIDYAFEQTHHIPPIHHEHVHGSEAHKLEILINNVKHAIKASNVDTAQKMLSEAKEIFDDLDVDEHKKELLKFELQELKTEIDLALLGK